MSVHLISFDIEEWWSVESFRHFISFGSLQSVNDRVNIGLVKILGLLKKYNYKATFFILGRVAEKYPHIVKKILNEGHDIGTHGYGHKLLTEQTQGEFEEDLIRSIKIIEEITGIRVTKYRAPSYSIREDTLWALDILAENGIDTDSSIMSTKNRRFGINNAPLHPYKVFLPRSNRYITEIPPSVLNIGTYGLPIINGFAFRLFPKFLIDIALQKYKKRGAPGMIILHNWEFDPMHPKMKVGFKGNLLHYLNLSHTERKLEYFFKKYKFYCFKELGEVKSEFKFEDLLGKGRFISCQETYYRNR